MLICIDKRSYSSTDQLMNRSLFNPLTTFVHYHIETSRLVCSTNQMTSFCMGNTGCQWVKLSKTLTLQYPLPMIDIYVGSNRFYQISTLPGVFLNFLKFDVHKSCRLLEKDVKLKRYSKLVKTQKMCPFISPQYQRSFASISSVVQVWAAKVIYSYRGNRPKVFCKKGVLENFAKFTGKHLCRSLKKLRYMVTDVFL